MRVCARVRACMHVSIFMCMCMWVFNMSAYYPLSLLFSAPTVSHAYMSYFCTGLNPSLVGLSIVYVLFLTDMCQYTMKLNGEVENFVSYC